jgi:hypothetical protein
MSDVYTVEIERRLQNLMFEVARLRGLITEVRQQLPKAWAGPGSGSGGSPKGAYYTLGDGVAHAATGTTAGTLVPATFTGDVYQIVGGALSLVAGSATINWVYKDDMSTTAGKIIPVVPNADGTTWDAQLESCKAINE